jgi:hypothetical protein
LEKLTKEVTSIVPLALLVTPGAHYGQVRYSELKWLKCSKGSKGQKRSHRDTEVSLLFVKTAKIIGGTLANGSGIYGLKID